MRRKFERPDSTWDFFIRAKRDAGVSEPQASSTGRGEGGKDGHNRAVHFRQPRNRAGELASSGSSRNANFTSLSLSLSLRSLSTDRHQSGLPTLGDVYEATVETEKGPYEKLHIFDTPGSVSNMYIRMYVLCNLMFRVRSCLRIRKKNTNRNTISTLQM